MPRLKDATKAARRNDILDAAVRAIAKHGYAGTSMRVIAEEAGLTKGGLYAYVPGKEAILLAVAERYFQAQLQDLRAARGASPREQLHAFFARHASPEQDPRMAETQRAILDLWSLATDLPGVRAALEQRYRRYKGTVAGIIRTGQRRGEFRKDAKADDLAAILLAARDGMVFHRVKLGLPVSVGPLTALLCAVLLEYLEG